MQTISERKAFSEQMLKKLSSEISKLPTIYNVKDNLCIYATGSYARGEASSNSDIDIFFICKGENSIKHLDEILLKADLIKIIRELGLPDFSGDGEFLTIHSIEDILKKLGSAEDDHKNYFTARMLLLLESKPLYNESLYKTILADIIDIYFNVYAKHEENFTPLFLANDIIRFWKTLCLNYEFKRISNGEDEFKINKTRIKNLKLKFSRLTTCYSLLVCLEDNESSTPEMLIKFILMTPIERLEFIKSKNISAKEIVDKMLALYDWFLRTTGQEQDSLYQWISKKGNRDEVLEKANEYHDLFYLLIELTSQKLLKFYTL